MYFLRLYLTDGLKHLVLLIAHLFCVEQDGRLHGSESEELQHVILNHVPERSRPFVVPAAVLHTNGLRRGDLHMVDVVPIPYRFEDPIGEAEHQQVLHRLLAEIMVDAVHLRLVEHAEDGGVQLS
jgi:hypothetical protein